MLEQRKLLHKYYPEIDIDKFNKNLNSITNNKTLASVLMSCQSLPGAIQTSYLSGNMDLFASVANVLLSDEIFRCESKELVQSIQQAISKDSAYGINTSQFQSKVRQTKFNLDKYKTHNSASCTIL